MSTTLYERYIVELIFYKDGRKCADGRKLIEQAPFVFMKVADNKNFVVPIPPTKLNFHHRYMEKNDNFCKPSNWDIVHIHFLDKRAAIPQDQYGKQGCQFFGDV